MGAWLIPKIESVAELACIGDVSFITLASEQPNVSRRALPATVPTTSVAAAELADFSLVIAIALAH
jgi:hypothetical protein